MKGIQLNAESAYSCTAAQRPIITSVLQNSVPR